MRDAMSIGMATMTVPNDLTGARRQAQANADYARAPRYVYTLSTARLEVTDQAPTNPTLRARHVMTCYPVQAGNVCSNCGASPAPRTSGNEPACEACYLAGLVHGHAHVDHDPPVADCPLCQALIGR